MAEVSHPVTRKVVAVIGSGDDRLPTERARIPFFVGQWIARANFHLLTGGGPGVMAAASEGFCSVASREGIAIGVIPEGKPPDAYPNRWIELPIYTHLRGEDPKGPDSRNHINIRTAHAVVAFPGGMGTRAELELAKDRGRTFPLVACLGDGDMIGDLTRHTLQDFGVPVVETAEGVVQFLTSALA